MIIVRIVSGLSSQLHKCAVGRALALRLGTEPKLDLDWFDNPPTTDARGPISSKNSPWWRVWPNRSKFGVCAVIPCGTVWFGMSIVSGVYRC